MPAVNISLYLGPPVCDCLEPIGIFEAFFYDPAKPNQPASIEAAPSIGPQRAPLRAWSPDPPQNSSDNMYI